MKQKRQKAENTKKEARKHKNYEDYNWKELYQNKNIASLKVPELNKYLVYHNLSKRADKMKKNDKVSLVKAHIGMTHLSGMLNDDANEENPDDVEEGDDIVISEWGTTQNAENGQPEIFCLCRQPEDERFMVCCDMCDEWYHGDCIDLSDEEAEKYMSDPELEFVCPLCTVIKFSSQLILMAQNI